jgi:hypothetical protein
MCGQTVALTFSFYFLFSFFIQMKLLSFLLRNVIALLLAIQVTSAPASDLTEVVVPMDTAALPAGYDAAKKAGITVGILSSQASPAHLLQKRQVDIILCDCALPYANDCQTILEFLSENGGAQACVSQYRAYYASYGECEFTFFNYDLDYTTCIYYGTWEYYGAYVFDYCYGQRGGGRLLPNSFDFGVSIAVGTPSDFCH